MNIALSSKSAAVLAVSLVVSGVALTSAHAAVPRIIGGVSIGIEQAPWQVLISAAGDEQCGGSLISNDVILTAAHCFAQGTQAKAFSGVTSTSNIVSSNQLKIAKITLHPQYNKTTYVNDLALVKLAKPIVPSAKQHAIALPVSQGESWPGQGVNVTATGWGATGEKSGASKKLLAGNMQVLAGPTGPCGKYGKDFAGESVICAGVTSGAIDACQGDSGGPLVTMVNNIPVLAGVTSVGRECGDANYPGIYSRVTSQLDWLRTSAGIASTAPGAPSALTGNSGADGSIKVTWKPTGTSATTYIATATPGGATCYSATTSCVFGKLPLGKTYSIAMVATNAAGTSGPSAPIQVSAVNATAPAGSKVGAEVLAKAVGLSGSAALSNASGSCTINGTALSLTKSGVCSVTVSANGKSKPLFIAVS